MRRLTLDASVMLKWYLRTPDEADLDEADALLGQLQQDDVTLVQPPHTLLEVAAVLARKRCDSLDVDLPELMAVLAPAETPEIDQILPRGVELCAQLDHHLFDTLYHAAALETGATLVTADERYYAKAARLGNVVLLRDLLRVARP